MIRRLAAPLLLVPFLLSSAALAAGSASVQPTPYRELATVPLPQLKAALQQAGWPAAHVQAFLNAETQQRFNPPYEAKASDLRPFEFWRTGPDAEPFSPADLRARETERARREEQAREAFDALFPAQETETNPALAAWNEEREWGRMPAEKRRAVSAILRQADEGRDAILHSRGGMLTRAEWETVWQIHERARAEIERVLLPAELLDYDLRTSATANRMRRELDNFQPTKEEFLALFRLRHPLELAFDHKMRGSDAALDRQRAEAEGRVEEQIQALLGAQRYDDYRLSLQPACQLLQFDGRFAQISAAEVRTLYRSLLKTQRDLAEINASPRSDADKRAARDAAKARLYEQFRAKLDEEGVRRYLQEQELWP